MNIMIAMMKMLPLTVKNRMKPPMLSKARLVEGKKHPTIKMNISNLLICSQYCGTCPSNPNAKDGKALYCATGKSSAKVEENGCNCVDCPLLEKCSRDNTVYFCKSGACSGRDVSGSSMATSPSEYMKRFMIHGQQMLAAELMEKRIQEDNLTGSELKDVKINFVGDKEVKTKSNIPILKASLDAGIPHTHVCGGRAKCSTCRVIVTEGLLKCTPRNEKEARLAHVKGFTPEVRLACQTTVNGDVSLRRLVLDASDVSEAIKQRQSTSGEGGREEKLAILFSDIRSFTSFSEKALPYDIIHILNRYFDTIGEHIDNNGGYIDKYMGDGIMAIFGLDEKSRPHPALYAVQAAQKIIDGLNEFNNYLQPHFNHQFKIGIGIHTGDVIVGNLGYRKKKEFTAIGDTVNTASRIESLTKRAGTPVLVSEDTYILVKDSFKWGKQYKANVKGKEKPITVYEPLFDYEALNGQK